MTDLIVDQYLSGSKQKRRLKLSTMTMSCPLLFFVLLIIVLAIVTGVCIVKINQLNRKLETENLVIGVQRTKINNSIEQIQRLTNELKHLQQYLSMFNRMMYSFSCD